MNSMEKDSGEKNTKVKNTKEKILEEALKLFAQRGYVGTSMSDIATALGVTKAALYKHYTSKQQILDSIVEKMNHMDMARVKEYDMPDGDLEEVRRAYQEVEPNKIKEFTRVQFSYWTEEEFSGCFRRMLTLERYRNPELAKLYQHYLSNGPLSYMEEIFKGFTNDEGEARQLALDFYGPIFLLYSIYDEIDDKESIFSQLEQHVERFSKKLFTK